MQVFDTEKKCIRYLESKLWENGKPVSPYDPTSKVYRRGDGMYRCKNTGKNFNVRIGTLFEGSKISLCKWFYAVYIPQFGLMKSSYFGVNSAEFILSIFILDRKKNVSQKVFRTESTVFLSLFLPSQTPY